MRYPQTKKEKKKVEGEGWKNGKARQGCPVLSLCRVSDCPLITTLIIIFSFLGAIKMDRI